MFNNTGNKRTHISLAVISLLSALALTACGGGDGDDKGGSKNHQGDGSQNSLPASGLNTTYYQIEDNYSKDISQRKIDVRELVIENGKVTTETKFRASGDGSVDHWIDTHKPSLMLLSPNIAVNGTSFLSDEVMDKDNRQVRFYPDKFQTLLKDTSNNNTIIASIPGSQLDLSGKKVYDSNSKIDTELNDRNGSVSEVYPQGASCWALGIESSLISTNKVYLMLDPTEKYNTTYANFTEWQDTMKKDLSSQAGFQLDGGFTDIKVGSNNEYDAQIVKVKMIGKDEKIQATVYISAMEYQGKVYNTSFVPAMYPNTKIEVDPSSPVIGSFRCMYYNKVAKDYIVNQLKTVP